MRSSALVPLYVAALLAVAMPGARLQAIPSVTGVSFGQLDWFDSGGALVTPDSVWGALEFDYDPDPASTFYLNVAASVAGGPADWSVQNLPLFQSSLFSSQRLGVDIDLSALGVSSGTAISAIDLIFSVDSAVQAAAPVGSALNVAVDDIVRFAWQDNDGPAGGTFADPGTPLGHKAAGAVADMSKERDIKPVQEGDRECFPGAIARSVEWLDRTHELGIGKTTAQILADMKAKVANPPAGLSIIASETRKIGLKNDYAREKSGNHVVTKVFDPRDLVNAIPGVKETTPTDKDLLEFLFGEMKDGEDVELAYFWDGGAHIVTITKIWKTADGKTMVLYRDDEHQGDDTKGDKASKQAELRKKANGDYSFRTTDTTVWYALSESFVPEPGTLVLLSGALLALGTVRRRRASAADG